MATSNITKLFEQAKKELIADIKSGKIKLNEGIKPKIVKIEKIVNDVPIMKKYNRHTITLDNGKKVPINADEITGIYGGDINKLDQYKGQEWDQEYNKLSEAADPSEVKEISKLVKVANILIEKGKDKDGDKLEVVDPESTYEEPYTYDTIKMEEDKVTVTSYATMKGNKKEVDVMKVDNISDDLEGYLKSIIKGFKRAYKEAGIALPTNSTVTEDTVLIPSSTGDATDPLAKKAAQDAINKGNTATIVKKGSTLAEAKDEEETPDEDTEETPEEDTKPTPDSISAELDEHIRAAVDSAADFIKSIDDKKYETALGKVIKNLTAAQAALDAVKQHETKLAEEAGINRDKSLQKYWKEFMKYIKKNVKDEVLIAKLERMYKKVIEKYHDNKVPADKMTEQVWQHFTLNESRMLAEAKGAYDTAIDFITSPNANPVLKDISQDIELGKYGEKATLIYKKGEDLPVEALKKLKLQFEPKKIGKVYTLTLNPSAFKKNPADIGGDVMKNM